MKITNWIYSINKILEMSFSRKIKQLIEVAWLKILFLRKRLFELQKRQL
ncbi:unnamed protein product [Onchocerca flexuosa]|uniref:Uncharacterized protein n=1 Tax=Onchocerca flexuosa TaxID=387005 RepID=A0A183HXI2_9BILA|nr:unnamed protein product [Onchocerca flexuosa]